MHDLKIIGQAAFWGCIAGLMVMMAVGVWEQYRPIFKGDDIDRFNRVLRRLFVSVWLLFLVVYVLLEG